MNPQNQLLELAKTVNPRWLEREIRKCPDLLLFVEQYWNQDWGSPRIFLEMAWHAAHGTTPMCNQEVKKPWLSWNEGVTYCEKHCHCAKIARKATMMKNHGVEHPLQSENLKNKAKQTLVINHGTDQLHMVNSDKKRKTNVERYGASTPLQSNIIREKAKQTLLKSHGVEHPFNSNTIQENIQTAWLAKSGKKSFARSKSSIQQQNIQILQEKLGDKIIYVTDPELFSSMLRTMSRTEMANFVGCSTALIDKRIGEWDLTEFQDTPSHYETVISNFLSSFNIEYQTNTRKIIPPKEIDWWIPSYNLGIEFCGLRWHGEAVGRGKDYHVGKYNEMKKIGNSLITIFQDEWDKNSTIIKSVLTHRLGVADTKIMARKSKLVILDNVTYSNFMNTNHLQGSSLGDVVRIGLIFEDTLVAAIGYRKHRKYGWEISRHANKLNTVVVGGFGKMFDYFIKTYNPTQVLSYADLRYFTGLSLKNHGFICDGNTNPGYSYSKGIIRSHRLNHTKKILVKQGYDPEKTESQIMKDLGWDVIWDCGHARWIWTNE